MHSRKIFPPRHAALALWMAGTCAAALAAGADQLQATLDRMDRAAAGFKGLSADLTQVSHTDVINVDEKSSGSMAVRCPKPHELRARVDILEPKPDAKKVLLTPHRVEMYYPKNNTVQIIDLDRKSSSLVHQFMLLGFGSTSAEIRNSYKVELGGPETVAGQKTVRLVLTPRSADVLAQLTKVELWISDTLGIAVQQKLYEPGDDYILATYTNVKLNPGTPELKWDIPKNAVPQKLN
ncbi:MAG: outer membrane lipoprotein carrier protein LolA [Bryobacteraceae bacterium]